MMIKMNSSLHKNFTSYLFAFLVSAIFFLLNITKISFFFYVGIVFFILLLFFFNDQQIFLIICFLIPNLFMFKQIGTNSAILGYFFMLLSVKTLLTKKTIKNAVNLIAISFLLTCFTSLLFLDLSLLFSALRFSFNFYLFVYLANQNKENKQIDDCTLSFLVGVIVSVIFGLIYHSSIGNLYNGLFAGVNSGRNYFEAAISPTITIAVLFLMEEKRRVTDIIIAFAASLCALVSIVLSGSRTSIVLMIIPAFLVLTYFFNIKKLKKLIPLLIGIFVIGFFVYNKYSDSITYVLNRFSDSTVMTGNRRTELWDYYFHESFSSASSFLIGNSSQNVTYLTETGVQMVEHNTVIQSLYELGYLNSLVLLLLVIFVSLLFLKNRRINLRSLFPGLIVFASYFCISALFADQVSFFIVFCLLIMHRYSKKTERQKTINFACPRVNEYGS